METVRRLTKGCFHRRKFPNLKTVIILLEAREQN